MSTREYQLIHPIPKTKRRKGRRSDPRGSNGK